MAEVNLYEQNALTTISNTYNEFLQKTIWKAHIFLGDLKRNILKTSYCALMHIWPNEIRALDNNVHLSSDSSSALKQYFLETHKANTEMGSNQIKASLSK